MHNHLYVIIILAFIGKEITTTEGCGTLSSSPVTEGQNAKLEFIPQKKYSEHSRMWIHNPWGNEHVLLFDSANTTFMSDRYYEVTTYKGYLLIIQNATFENAEGVYAVRCQGNKYSNTVRLYVSKAESTTSIPYAHNRFTTNRKNVTVTHFTTSNPPSMHAVYIATTQRQEVTPTTIHVPNIQGSSTEEGRNISITSKQPSTTPANRVKPKTSIHVTYTHGSSTDEGKDISITTLQPSTKAVISIIATEQEVKTYQNKGDEEPVKEIPNQSTTTKEKTSASTENEKGINIEELKLLIPITVSVVGIVVTVAVGTVCVTVRKKKRKEETHIERSEVESDDKGDSHRDGRSAEVVQCPGGFQVQGRVRRSSKSAFHLFHEQMATTAHPSSSDATPDVQAQASEIPEYASVIPKEKRASEAKQNTKKTENSLICDNKENQLVYAELDLQPLTNNRPTTSRYEATEYVTIDFSRTGTSQAETGLPEQTETTEYVSVDFSRSETTEADTGLLEQKATTEYVSVDFSKTGTSEPDTVVPNQNDTVEYVSVDLSKKAELQTEDQGAEI